jgi:hypothetical protein
LPPGKDVSMEAQDLVGICYRATTGEDTADWEDLVCAVAICKAYKSVRLLRVICSYEL